MTLQARSAFPWMLIGTLGLWSGCAGADEQRPGDPLDSVPVAQQALSTTGFVDTHRNALPNLSGCDGRAAEAGGIDREIWGVEPSGDGTVRKQALAQGEAKGRAEG